MSFMAGFGPAFSRSFENARERTAQEEQDMFKLTFNTYLEKDTERKKAEAADAANVKKAQALSEVLPGVNRKAATAQIYKMLNAGLDEDFILEELRKPGAQIEFQDQVKQNKDSLEAQTEAVTAPGSSVQKQQNLQQVEQLQSQEKPQSWRDSFAGGLFGSPYSKKERKLEKAQQKVSDYTGVPVDKIRGTLTGRYETGKLIDTSGVTFTPGANPKQAPKTAKEALLASQEAYSRGDQSEGDRMRRIYDTYMQAVSDEEKAKVLGQEGLRAGAPVKIFDPSTNTWRITSAVPGMPDQDGQNTLVDAETGQPINPQLAQGIGEDEAKASEAIRKGLEKETIAHAARQANFGNVLHSMSRAIEIGRNNPQALTYYTSSGASLINNLRQEGINIYQMGSEIINGVKTNKFNVEDVARGKSQIEKNMLALDKQLEQGKISQVAADAARLKMYTTLMTYEVAMAYGQEGRAMSDTDRKLFEQVVSDQVEPQRQLQALSELMVQLEGNLDRQAQSLFGNNSPNVAGFMSRYRYNPLGNVARPVSEVVVANDPRLKASYDFMRSSLNRSGVIQRDPIAPARPITPPGQMQQPQGIQIPRGAIEALRQNPNLIEQFKQKYGLDDAGVQSILQGG